MRLYDDKHRLMERNNPREPGSCGGYQSVPAQDRAKLLRAIISEHLARKRSQTRAISTGEYHGPVSAAHDLVSVPHSHWFAFLCYSTLGQLAILSHTAAPVF